MYLFIYLLPCRVSIFAIKMCHWCMLTTADLAAGITVIFSTVQPFWKLMVSIFGDPFSFFWDQVNTTCSWANTAGMNGIKLSLLKRYNTSLAPNGAKFYRCAFFQLTSTVWSNTHDLWHHIVCWIAWGCLRIEMKYVACFCCSKKECL